MHNSAPLKKQEKETRNLNKIFWQELAEMGRNAMAKAL